VTLSTLLLTKWMRPEGQNNDLQSTSDLPSFFFLISFCSIVCCLKKISIRGYYSNKTVKEWADFWSYKMSPFFSPFFYFVQMWLNQEDAEILTVIFFSTDSITVIWEVFVVQLIRSCNPDRHWPFVVLKNQDRLVLFPCRWIYCLAREWFQETSQPSFKVTIKS